MHLARKPELKTGMGGEVIRMKKMFAAVLALALALPLTASAQQAGFDDVPANHPHKAAIEYCRLNGFVNGTSATTFDPDGSLSRIHFAMIWARTLHIREQNHTFADVTKLENSYDTLAIVLSALGIMNGTSATKFSPYTLVTREQLALMTARTYQLGVADPDAYQRYEDAASISPWARDGISACLNAGVLAGLYDGANFEPSRPATRAEICKMIYNLTPVYDVTVAELNGGSIAASPTRARPGTWIALTITPEDGKRLKPGTLKYNDTVLSNESGFAMPAEDVTITAEFEEKPVLESIEITSEPTKTEYAAGETLNLSGLVVTAHYSDESGKPVTGYTTSPAAGAELNSPGTQTVTVSYTEGGVTKTASFEVEVSATAG